ncbi:MAG TPA: hypothetical protein DHW39_01320 [Erysipelotrichaceae bacterium]|nr:hypothetical protein [Erysipelotrichaceae bacterium]
MFPLFPTYFDESLLLHRLLHDETYQASAEDRAFALEAEKALLNGDSGNCPCNDRMRMYNMNELGEGYEIQKRKRLEGML